MPAKRSYSSGQSSSRRGRPSDNRGGRNKSFSSRSAAPRKHDSFDFEGLIAPEVEIDLETMTWEKLGLQEELVKALNKEGLTKPFAIQARTLPDSIAGRDLLGRAQTGSGKTLAFGLAMLSRLLGGSKRRPGSPRGLVLVPTRELAVQVDEQLAALGRHIGIKVLAVYGGAPMRRQIDMLDRGVDIVIATPGRLLDLVSQGVCILGQVETCVLDEADYMADLGFLPDVSEILTAVPADAQHLLFSATLDNDVASLVKRYLNDPVVHVVGAAVQPVTTMDHRVFSLNAEHKVAVAAEIAGRPGRTLLFVRTKIGADRLVEQFQKAGVKAAAIHGNLKQSARQRALDSFARGTTRVLIATDVAARGLDINDVDLVVHYDPPDDHKFYLHRSGRTARAGSSGVVLSLLLPREINKVRRVHERAGVKAKPISVHPGHLAVREIATSGEEIEIKYPKKSESRTSSYDKRTPGGNGSRRRSNRRRNPRAAA